MSNVQENRWIADPDQFAARVQVDDVKGLLANQLIVDPGTSPLTCPHSSRRPAKRRRGQAT